MTVTRDGEVYEETLTPVKAKNGTYMLGLWIKDDLAGVGTMTYFTQTGEFGALGHGMGDGETQNLFQIEDGDIYVSELLGIDKGTRGEPGQVKGVLHYGEKNHLGQLEENLNRSLMSVTALNVHIGYENCAKVAQLAHKQGLTLKQACVKLGLMSEEQFDKVFDPHKMI